MASVIVYVFCNQYLWENKLSSSFQNENLNATSCLKYFMFRFVRKIIVLYQMLNCLPICTVEKKSCLFTCNYVEIHFLSQCPANGQFMSLKH